MAQEARPHEAFPEIMMRLYVMHAKPSWLQPDAGTPAAKVGISRDPFRRKWGVRRKGCDSPKLIWQSGQMPRSRALQSEAAIKRRLAQYSAGGEWFFLEPRTLVRYIKANLGPKGTAPFTGGPQQRGKR
jgi:hypothetical protein